MKQALLDFQNFLILVKYCNQLGTFKNYQCQASPKEVFFKLIWSAVSVSGISRAPWIILTCCQGWELLDKEDGVRLLGKPQPNKLESPKAERTQESVFIKALRWFQCAAKAKTTACGVQVFSKSACTPPLPSTLGLF